MTAVTKTRTPLPSGDVMIVEEKVARGTTINVGDEVFVWTAETQGGTGLVARGLIEAVGAMDDERRCSISIRLQPGRPLQPLGKAELARHDQRRTGEAATSPTGRLATKLYAHSLNRIVALDQDEADHLRQQF